MTWRPQLIGAALVAALLVLHGSTFQVRFDEAAVVTTFGRADDAGALHGEDGGAGLHFKWPWPIQDVKRFDTRLRVLDDQLEQQETSDRQVVVVQTYVVWRIADALAFHRALRTDVRAERFLRDRLRTARGEMARFSFEELVSSDEQVSRIPEAEAALLDRVRADLDERASGVDVLELGIRRIVLPEEISAAVFSRMKQTRKRMAQAARSEGEAMAREIRATARSASRRIGAFAERVAQDIRAQGDAAAAEHYSVFAEDEELAVYLRKLEALETALAADTTYLLDTDTAPFDLMRRRVAEPAGTRSDGDDR